MSKHEQTPTLAGTSGLQRDVLAVLQHRHRPTADEVCDVLLTVYPDLDTMRVRDALRDLARDGYVTRDNGWTLDGDVYLAMAAHTQFQRTLEVDRP